LTAEIADDGTGRARDADDGGEHGSGLAGMAERAREAGAELTAGEGPGGKGFRILVRVPASRSSAPDALQGV
jgi:signal transduction histidine kinase